MYFFIFITLVVSAYVATYFALYYMMPFLFEQRAAHLGKRSLYSLAIIFALTLVTLSLSASVADAEWSNRLQHAFGGGFSAFIVYFLAVKDSGVRITALQLFILGLLIVTALGVGNELIEFLGQTYTNFIFATHINDTWFDLLSNTVGALFAALALAPFANGLRGS